jgi:hypothetical protein
MPEKRSMVERACAQCATLFICRSDTKQRFCSAACVGLARRRNWVDRDCQRCGMPYSVYVAYNTKFCSRACKTGTDEERFWSKVERGDGCWRWTGYLSGNYGRMRWRGQMVLAHRVSWMIHVGPLSATDLVLHKCAGGGNPWCVNPSHLSVGDQRENARDMMRADRHWSSTGVWSPTKGDKSPAAKLTSAQVAEARRRVAAGEFCKAVAEQMGLPYRLLNPAVSGGSWKHLTDPPPVKSKNGGNRKIPTALQRAV